MIISVIGMLIGALVAGVGVYQLIKEKQDKESVKIYGIISGVGGVIFIGMLVKLILELLQWRRIYREDYFIRDRFKFCVNSKN